MENVSDLILISIENGTDFKNASRRSSSVTTFPVTFYISLLLIWIPGTTINFVSLFFIIKDIRKAVFPAAILLLMLCCSDLGAVILSCARHILVKYIGQQTYPMCAFLGTFYNFSKMSSGILNCLMTADRVLAICYPFIYKRHVTVKTWVIGSFIAGILVAIHSFFPIIGFGDVIIMRRGSIYCSALSYREEPIQRVYGMLFGIFGVLFVFFVVSGNVIIIRTLIRLGNKVAHFSVNSETCSWTETTNSDGEKRSSALTTPFEIAVAKLMIGYAVAYLVCGTPYNVSGKVLVS